MRKILFAAVCVVLISCVAAAQDFPRVEIFGGYSLGRLGGDASDLYDGWKEGTSYLEDEFDSFAYSSSQWFKKGFMASAAFNVNEYFGIEALVNFNAGTMSEFSLSDSYEGYYETSANGKQKGSLFAFMAGPKFTYRSEAVTPFAHFLVGINRVNMNYDASCSESYEGEPSDCTSEMVDYFQSMSDGLYFIDDSDIGFAFAVGGGLDVNVNDSFAVRVIQVDLINAFHGEDDFDFTLRNLNIAFGAVFRIGQ